MPFVPATNVLQCELFFTWAGQRVENVLHYQSPGAPSAIGAELLGDALINWWTTNLRPLSPATLSMISVKMTDLTTISSPVIERSTGLPLAGTGVGDSMPNNVSLVFTKRTNSRGRSYRGRIYHLGLLETQVAGSFVLNTHLAALLGHYALLLFFNILGEAWNLVVVSRFSNGVPRGSAVVTPVTSIFGETTIDSQRRRLPGRGR